MIFSHLNWSHNDTHINVLVIVQQYILFYHCLLFAENSLIANMVKLKSLYCCPLLQYRNLCITWHFIGTYRYWWWERVSIKCQKFISFTCSQISQSVFSRLIISLRDSTLVVIAAWEMSEGVRGSEWEVRWPLPVRLWCRHSHPSYYTAVSFTPIHWSYCRKLGLFIVHTLLEILFQWT